MASVTVGLGRLWPRAAGGRLLLQQATVSPFYLRTISILSNSLEQPLRSSFSFKPAGVCQGLAGPVSSWNHQQIRTKARGNEYQPNNRKRKRTHGWIKRISTPAGIEVILRRMLKGRKSLSH
nr:PREDICTED: 39S ribosomal protein L34, mitochondrial [Apteryx mantelli mantelli]